MLARFRSHLRQQPVAYLALFVAVGGTGAYAANTIRSGDIVDGEVKNPDLGANSVGPAKVIDSSLTATEIALDSLGGGRILESSLAKVPSAGRADSATNAKKAAKATSATKAASADKLGGLLPDSFERSTVVSYADARHATTTKYGLATFEELGVQIATDGDADSNQELRVDSLRNLSNIIGRVHNAGGGDVFTVEPQESVQINDDGETDGLMTFFVTDPSSGTKSLDARCWFLPEGGVHRVRCWFVRSHAG